MRESPAANPLPAERRGLTGSRRDLAWLYAPPAQRAVLGALLEIEREIGAALRRGLDHTVAHARLGWWREECARCARGRPAHPAGRALIAAVGEPADPTGLLAAAEWDLAAATFESRAQLVGYCERWASSFTEIAARGALGSAQSGSADRDVRAHFGRSLGVALKEIELLTSLADDAGAGRLRLPLDELERIGVEPSTLASRDWPPELRMHVAARHRAARNMVADSFARLPPAHQPALRGLIVWAALAVRASHRAERLLSAAAPPGRIASARMLGGRARSDRGRVGGKQGGGIESVGRISDAWLAWRAARRADRRSFTIERERPT